MLPPVSAVQVYHVLERLLSSSKIRLSLLKMLSR